MNKFFGALVGILMTFASAQAHAELLTDWNYTLDRVTFTNHNEDLVTINPNGVPGSFSWTGGMYENQLSPDTTPSQNGSFEFSESSNTANIVPDDVLSQSTEAGDVNPGFGIQNLATMNFSYDIISADGSVSFSITYSIPLQTYYDHATGTEYIFYSADDILTSGATAATHDGYSYGVTGMGFFVDGRALSSLTIGSETVYGWAINKDTRENTYDSYVVGEDNVATGTKSWVGAFDIDASLTVTYSKADTEPTPTPEPATMVLTGLGLAGIAAYKRRRNG